MTDTSPHSPGNSQKANLGIVLLMGSGETSSSGRRMHHDMFVALGVPVRVAILETPAGFELNSSMVAGRVGDFIAARLANFSPRVSIIPARRRDGKFSTENPEVLQPLLDANYIFAGPGSPTYLVRHLKNTLAWHYLVGRHGNGATLCMASAAAIAFGCCTVPVYEIFKAGCDPYWADGLDFFGAFGLKLAIVSHWDNQEGGANLDTSHCFIGRPRMEKLRECLPPDVKVLGIDEHTGLAFDFGERQCRVMGRGGVTILSPGLMRVFEAGATFPFNELGQYHQPDSLPRSQIRPGEVGEPVRAGPLEKPEEVEIPAEVLDLVQKRQAAREKRRWAESDAIRQQIAEMGFEVKDTREGPRVGRVSVR